MAYLVCWMPTTTVGLRLTKQYSIISMSKAAKLEQLSRLLLASALPGSGGNAFYKCDVILCIIKEIHGRA